MAEPEAEPEPEPEQEAEPEPEPTGLIVHVLLVRVQARNARLVRFLRRPEVQKLWDRSSFQAFASVKADTVQSARLECGADGALTVMDACRQLAKVAGVKAAQIPTRWCGRDVETWGRSDRWVALSLFLPLPARPPARVLSPALLTNKKPHAWSAPSRSTPTCRAWTWRTSSCQSRRGRAAACPL